MNSVIVVKNRLSQLKIQNYLLESKIDIRNHNKKTIIQFVRIARNISTQYTKR